MFITSVVVILRFLYFVFRFIAFPSIISAPYGPIRPLTPFVVTPELYVRDPPHELLYYTQGFRREIMTVFADLLLLTDDALFRSYIEHRPLRQYKSRVKYANASKLYPQGECPYEELLSIARNCSPQWVSIVQGLM